MRHTRRHAASRNASSGDPHWILALIAAVVVALEALRGSATLLSSPVWPSLQGLAAAAGLILVWQRQQRLKLPRVLFIAAVFQLTMIAVHLALGVKSDGDSSSVFAREGHALLSGTYPHSLYPPGGLLVFALDRLLAGGGMATRVSHGFVMVPFQLATVAALWSLRTRWSAWFATFIALWPLNAFFWEFKYDLAPTAALILGLVLASRRRWALAGLVLGLGAALKWTPALAGVALILWLIGRRELRAALAHLGALAGSFLAVNLPFLLTSPGALLAAYRLQSGRGISAESVFYIPPVIGFEHPVSVISHEVGAPHWANVATGVFQALLVLTMLLLVARAKTLRTALALSAMAPVLFLLTNRVFSPQYLVTALAAWAFAGTLITQTAREQILLGGLIGAATLCNVLVYPTGVRLWPTFTLLLFALAFAATAYVILKARKLDRTPSLASAPCSPVAGLQAVYAE